MKRLIMNADLCTGCLQCEMACSYDNEGLFNPARSRIKVFEQGHGLRAIPYTCTQCEPAWCMQACPTQAISVASDGVKIVDEALCVGCKVCVNACPYGTMHYHPEKGKVHKCDLCGGDPECAKACPTGAITYTNEEQIA